MRSKTSTDPTRPSLFECHSRYTCKKVDAVWRSSKLDDAPLSRQIFQTKIQTSESEFMQHIQETLSIVGSCSHQEVNVTSESRVAMERDSVPADNEILNLP